MSNHTTLVDTNKSTNVTTDLYTKGNIGRAPEPESNKIHAVGCRVPATGYVEDAVDARDVTDDNARGR